jgi:MscS family membrane protein
VFFSRFTHPLRPRHGDASRATAAKRRHCGQSRVARQLLVLAAVLWAALASGQTNTNRPALLTTNRPSALVHDLQQLETHSPTFHLDQVAPLNQIEILGVPLWKWLACAIYILLAFAIARLIDLVAHAWFKRLAGVWRRKHPAALPQASVVPDASSAEAGAVSGSPRVTSGFDDLLLALLRGPIKLLAFVLFLNIGLNVFDWPFKVRVYLANCLLLVVAGSLTWLAVKICGLLLEFWRKRMALEADKKFNDQLFAVLRKSLTAAIIIVAALVTAQNIGINITAALASLSIGGLAVGLAAQDTLANLFGALAVLADRPFVLGDTIKLDAAEGVVESIGLRSTRVRNAEGHLVTIPNKTIGNAAIANISQRANIRTLLNFSLPANLPAAKVRRALATLREVYGGHPMTHDLQISFHRFLGRRLHIQVQHWWKGAEDAKRVAAFHDMNLAVKERFDAEEIPFT